jgi:hypothetical protein
MARHVNERRIIGHEFFYHLKHLLCRSTSLGRNDFIGDEWVGCTVKMFSNFHASSTVCKKVEASGSWAHPKEHGDRGLEATYRVVA